MFRFVFVIDILKGRVVHAIKGVRENYYPVKDSKICSSADPVEMVSAVRPAEVYIADLDRLSNSGSNFEAIRKISGIAGTMVNIGIREKEDIEKCMAIADTVILSTEASSFEIMKYASLHHPGRTSITIDIKNGVVLTDDKDLKKKPEELVKLLNELKIRDIVIIDLSKVGSSEGINREFLRAVRKISNHDILFGGGIKGMDDIQILKEIGINGALVATAVHNGSIPIDLIR